MFQVSCWCPVIDNKFFDWLLLLMRFTNVLFFCRVVVSVEKKIGIVRDIARENQLQDISDAKSIFIPRDIPVLAGTLFHPYHINLFSLHSKLIICIKSCHNVFNFVMINWFKYCIKMLQFSIHIIFFSKHSRSTIYVTWKHWVLYAETLHKI